MLEKNKDSWGSIRIYVDGQVLLVGQGGEETQRNFSQYPQRVL
jgi:hypothetical protein